MATASAGGTGAAVLFAAVCAEAGNVVIWRARGSGRAEASRRCCMPAAAVSQWHLAVEAGYNVRVLREAA